MSHASMTTTPTPSADRLDADGILGALKPATARRIERLHVFASLDSTNRFLLDMPPPARGALDIAIADHQHAGRGRRGRRWTVPPGGGLCLSAAMRIATSRRELAALPLAAGVAARRAVRNACGVEVGLKWPNDLVWRDRKLGGILVEHGARESGALHVVIGIGINVAVPLAVLGRLSDWPAGAVDLATATSGRPPVRVVLAAALVDELGVLVDAFERHGSASWRDEFAAADVLRDRAVVVDDDRARTVGVARGVDADGAIVVEIADGSRRRVFAGDVSIRTAEQTEASA